jgi:hypothetical protein
MITIRSKPKQKKTIHMTAEEMEIRKWYRVVSAEIHVHLKGSLIIRLSPYRPIIAFTPHNILPVEWAFMKNYIIEEVEDVKIILEY